MSTSTRLVVLCGPSGAGKTTLAEALINHDRSPKPNIRFFGIGDTTRKRRPNDLPNEYYYIPRWWFWLKRLFRRYLWTAAFSGTRYGTDRRRFNEALRAHDYALMILIPERVKTVFELVPDQVLAFYVRAPIDGLEERLRRRGDSAKKIRRMLQESKDWDQLIVELGLASKMVMIDNSAPTIQLAKEQVLAELEKRGL